jgi:endonuclease YncB( thermonuclease family)
MKRFQTLTNSLPLIIVLILALVSAAHYLLLRNSGVNYSRTLLSTPFDQQSKTYQLVPGSIHDGDTLRVTDGNQEMKIRLCGIDAPEKDQPMGIAARDHLQSLIDKGNGSVMVVPVEKDRYGRTVAELFVKPRIEQGYQAGEEIAVNAQMIIDGYAYHYTQYSGRCPNGNVLANAEDEVRTAGRGVWKNSAAIKPWDYRREK